MVGKNIQDWDLNLTNIAVRLQCIHNLIYWLFVSVTSCQKFFSGFIITPSDVSGNRLLLNNFPPYSLITNLCILFYQKIKHGRYRTVCSSFQENLIGEAKGGDARRNNLSDIKAYNLREREGGVNMAARARLCACVRSCVRACVCMHEVS